MKTEDLIRCTLCGVDGPKADTKFLPLYVIGSEGTVACLACRISLTDHARHMMRLACQCRMAGYKSAKPKESRCAEALRPPRILRRRDVAERLARSERAVDRLAADGVLRKIRIPGRARALGFDEREVAALMESGGKGCRQEPEVKAHRRRSKMQIKQTKFKGISEVVTILDGVEAQKALVRIASYHQVPLEVIRNELAGGLRVSTCGAVYEATVAQVGATVTA